MDEPTTMTTSIPHKRPTPGLKAATKKLVLEQKDAAGSFKPRSGVDTTQPAKVWKDRDRFDGEALDALTIVLRTKGCEWLLKSGCTMCGYFSDSHFQEVTAANIIAQFENAMKEHHGEELIKIYTSGSFFDETEVPAAARQEILERVGSLTGRLSVESQPQILTTDNVQQATRLVDRFEVGFGMESTQDTVLAHSVNKSWRFPQFEKGASLLAENGGLVKTYLLLKPPFLGEDEAIQDTLLSVRKAAPLSHTVSINPVNIQRHTLTERMFDKGAYRPPWLWSASHVVRESIAELPEGVQLKCHAVGGGYARGAHNCGTCDDDHAKALEAWTLAADRRRLDKLFQKPCDCIEQWRFERSTRTLLAGGEWTDLRLF
jgi:archaeosine synthase beta-subunit